MSIIFGGSQVNAINYNGDPVKDVMYNSEHIWCVAPSLSTYHIQKSGSTYYIGPIVHNNSTKTVTYQVKNSSWGSKSVTLAADKSAQVVVATSSTQPSTANASWTVSYLGRILSFSTNGNIAIM